MSCTPKVTYKDQDIELKVMFSNEYQVRFQDGPELKGLDL